MIENKKVRERLDRVKIHGWQMLDLRNCGLKEIPEEIFNYQDLVTLDLGNDSFCDEKQRNKITFIPEKISNLRRLSKLDLSSNKVNNIHENISLLTSLQYLDLSKNELRHLSEKIANMPGLKEIILDDNPFDLLPPEIVARGIESIRNFIKELETKDYLYELKMLIVGEGRVGKTCISNALTDENFKLGDIKSTEGIIINRWNIPKEEMIKINPKIQGDFQINIWDFGGQEIYHSTHQFFLTKRSIYILVTESRKEDSHDDFFYWLNIIKLLGAQSPVIMVLNKCDQPTKEIPIKEYKDTFGNIVDFKKISLDGDYRDSFLDFRKSLITHASELPHIGNPLPKVWVDIRRELENLKNEGKNYITIEEYMGLCKKHYRNPESALYLSEYFHDLGVIIHFQDDIDLKDIIFLNHEWITKGVYKILDDREVIKKKGRFSNSDLFRIWYNSDHHNKMKELISLMKNRKFDLCFQLDNSEYLIPRLLPVDEIDHLWENSTENLKFEFRYKFMPKGILARLIVKLSSDIFEDMYWRYGVILQFENTRALIKEKYFENKVTVELSGTNKREFLFLIRKAVNEIHKDFNKLEVNEMIPCNCPYCKTVEDVFYYSSGLLKRYEINNIKTIRCDYSLQEVNVADLTDDLLRKNLSKDILIACENKNADLLKHLNLQNLLFFPETDSASVFIKVKTKPNFHGLRDRDFLLDSEIEKIKAKYPTLHILDYYCIENYLYHPDNILELKLQGFDKDTYMKDLIKQKNDNKNHIISIFRSARNNYQEFKIEAEKLRIKKDEDLVIDYLESDNIEVFLKAFSMKDYHKKHLISKYNLRESELASTKWFWEQLVQILGIS